MTKHEAGNAGRPGPDRRGLIVGAGAALAAPWLIRGAGAEDNVLFVNTWGGLWEETARKFLFDPFTAETGIQIRTVAPVSFAKLAGQARTGIYEFDVTTLGLAELGRANQARIIEPVDNSTLDQSKLFPGAVLLNGVKSHAFSNCIVYRKDKFPQGGPQSWAEFWDTARFNRPRSLQRYSARVMAFALLADGVAPDKLFPYDLNRGFAALDRIKPAIRVWWAQGPQSLQLIRDGEVDLIGMWTGQASLLAEQKVEAEVVWNQALVDEALWVVAKGTPRAKNAWRFIQSAVEPKRLAAFCIANRNGPLNLKALDHMEPDVARTMPTWPENFAKSIVLDAEKLAPQLDELNRRFDRWVTS
jgi:putative spermidine/putrescine transport system substrate-binding protein